MKDRQSYFNDFQLKLETNLENNKVLASKYRDTKYQMYSKKIKLFLKIEKSLDVYKNVTDKRQIQTLQTRMHNTLEDYFNYKSMFELINFSNVITSHVYLYSSSAW